MAPGSPLSVASGPFRFTSTRPNGDPQCLSHRSGGSVGLLQNYDLTMVGMSKRRVADARGSRRPPVMQQTGRSIVDTV